MPARRKRSRSRETVGDRAIRGLTELRDVLRSDVPQESAFTVRTVEVPAPAVFGPQRLRDLRARLHVSQAVFATLLGVSKVLIQSWEQGTREPSPLARRLLTEIECNPRRWERMIYASPTRLPRVKRRSA